jgi:hypothetical protein
MIFFYCFEKVGKPIQMLATGWSYQKKCLHLTNVKGLHRLKKSDIGNFLRLVLFRGCNFTSTILTGWGCLG